MVIEELVKTVLSELKRISSTETVVGEPIRAGEVTLVPVSKVSVGFGVGGGRTEEKNREGEGTGGGVVVEPIAFIVIRENKVDLLSLKKDAVGLGQVVDLIPEVLSTIKGWKGGGDKGPQSGTKGKK